MTIALLAQLESVPGAPSTNADRAVNVLLDHPDADIALFPELFLSGYALDRIQEAACDPTGAELARVRAAAARTRTAVVIGFAERAGAQTANSLACLGPDGRLAAVYRKMQLFDEERKVFIPGEELLIVDLAGRRVAPLVCFDIEFPELARRLARTGADLLTTASANMAPFYEEHSLVTRARALENHLPHLYTNLVGVVGAFHFVGGSRAISARGTILTELRHDREEVRQVTLEADTRDHTRSDHVRLAPPPNLTVVEVSAHR